MRCPKNHSTKTIGVIHSPTMVDAEDWKRWILLPGFERKWRQLGLNDDDLSKLQVLIMMNPKGPPVVKGTGGLRKARFWRANQGKSWGYRIGYAYFEEYGVIVAIAVYAKNDQSDIPAGQRAEIKVLITRLHRWVEDGG